MWAVGENRNENPGILTSPTLFGKWPSSLDCKHKLCNQITPITLQPQVELCWWIKSRICNWTHCQYDFHLIWLWFDFDLNTLPECDFDLFSFFDNMLFAKAGPGLIGQSLWVFIMTGNLKYSIKGKNLFQSKRDPTPVLWKHSQFFHVTFLGETEAGLFY